jgi:hypothetical protein
MTDRDAPDPFDAPLPNGKRPSEHSEEEIDAYIAGGVGNDSGEPPDIVAEVMRAPSEDFTGGSFDVNVGKEVMCAILEDTIEALTNNAEQDQHSAERSQRRVAIDRLAAKLAWAERQAVVNFWVRMTIDD